MKLLSNLINSTNLFSRPRNLTIHKGDTKTLSRVLRKHCVEDKDIRELLAILKTERPNYESLQLGERANDWILQVFGKVVNCVGKIDRDLTANSLALWVKQYYGIADEVFLKEM